MRRSQLANARRRFVVPPVKIGTQNCLFLGRVFNLANTCSEVSRRFANARPKFESPSLVEIGIKAVYFRRFSTLSGPNGDYLQNET